jgi:hypothetical protein
VEDIGWRVRKQQEFSHQFEQCNLAKPGFMSSVERFKGEKVEEPSHKDCWCQIKEVEKKNVEHLSPSFQSNCKKTEVFDDKNKGPSVGHYSMETSFIRQSFNSRFIKQGKNKTNKIKIWNDKEKDKFKNKNKEKEKDKDKEKGKERNKETNKEVNKEANKGANQKNNEE